MTAPRSIATIDQHVLTRTATGERVYRPFQIETSYADLSGDYDLRAWNAFAARDQSGWHTLVRRIHNAEVALAMLDAHVRGWAERNMVSTGDIHDLPAVLRRAIRIAEAMEDARELGVADADLAYARYGQGIPGQAEPHRSLPRSTIAARIGIDVADDMWRVIGIPWCNSYDAAYIDRVAEYLIGPRKES